MQVVHSLPSRYFEREERFVSSLIQHLFGPSASARYIDENESSWPLFSYSIEHSSGVTGVNLSFTSDSIGEVRALRSLLTMLADLTGENVPKLSTHKIQTDEQRCYAMCDSSGKVLGFASLEGDALDLEVSADVTSTMKSGVIASLSFPLVLRAGVHSVSSERVRASVASVLNVTHFKKVVVMESGLELDQQDTSMKPQAEDEVLVTLTLGRFSLPLATLLTLRNGSSLHLSGITDGAGTLQVGGEDVARASVRFEDGAIVVKVEEIL